MSVDELKTVANAVVAANSGGDLHSLLDQHYADDIVSVEAFDMPEGGREVRGKEALRGKWAWWEGAHEIHGASAEGPFLHGPDRFGVIFGMDVTNRESGERTQMRELGIYSVRDGKIVREEFFYT